MNGRIETYCFAKKNEVKLKIKGCQDFVRFKGAVGGKLPGMSKNKATLPDVLTLFNSQRRQKKVKKVIRIDGVQNLSTKRKKNDESGESPVQEHNVPRHLLEIDKLQTK